MNTKRMEGEGDVAFFIRNVLMASAAAMWAEVATIPLDTAKVRLQIQTVKPGEEPRYKGFIGTMTKVAAEEGPLALWSGLTPGLQRQFLFAGLRIGLYVPVRDMITGPLAPGQNPTLFQKILAGMTTGAIGISIANPTDVVKIRMQAQGRLPLEQRPYKNSIDCYKKTIAADGITGLWVGMVPNIMRNSIVNAAELASYDQFKQIATQMLGLDGAATTTHLSCAFLSGFVATCFGSPVDVIKTRLMNATPGEPAGLSLVTHMIKNEGLGSFYKGFQANFMRIGCWNIAMFLTLERIKKHYE